MFSVISILFQQSLELRKGDVYSDYTEERRRVFRLYWGKEMCIQIILRKGDVYSDYTEERRRVFRLYWGKETCIQIILRKGDVYSDYTEERRRVFRLYWGKETCIQIIYISLSLSYCLYLYYFSPIRFLFSK
jgi:hypothetical protein